MGVGQQIRLFVTSTPKLTVINSNFVGVFGVAGSRTTSLPGGALLEDDSEYMPALRIAPRRR